jgi:tRNA (cytosine34-C5)-methyltransferase
MPKFEPTSLDPISLLEMAECEGLRYYASCEDVPEALQKRIRASAFPPTAEEASKFHLERCLRCLPQDNNTGGFFVALLRKTATWSGADRRHERKQQSSSQIEGAEPETKRARGGSPSVIVGPTDEDKSDDLVDPAEDDDLDDEALDCLDADNKPVRAKTGDEPRTEDFGKDDFSAVSDEIMAPLIEHYGLINGFEKDVYMARACSDSKVIYYVARPVKRLFDLGIQNRVPIVNTGLKGFMRNNRNVAECAVSYRVCQEGVHFLVPFMTKRKFLVGLDDFRTCLGGNGKTIHLSQFSESFREQTTSLSPGSFVVVLNGFEEQLDQKLVLCMWKCRGDSVDGLVAKVEVDGILSKLDSIEQSKR